MATVRRCGTISGARGSRLIFRHEMSPIESTHRTRGITHDNRPMVAWLRIENKLEEQTSITKTLSLSGQLADDLIFGLACHRGFTQWTALYDAHTEIACLMRGRQGIRGFSILQRNTLSLAAKSAPAKDDACHHCKEVGHWKRNCPVYLAELQKKGSKLALPVLRDRKEVKQGALYFVPWAMVFRAQVEKGFKCQKEAKTSQKPTRNERDKNKSEESAKDHSRISPTQQERQYAEFFEKRLISQEISRREVDLEEIQEEKDTTPSEITSNIPQEVEGFEPPQEELNEPTSYKAAMLDLESNKWIDAMNAEIQSMMDNMVWVLVDLPPGCKTVGSSLQFIMPHAPGDHKGARTIKDANHNVYASCLTGGEMSILKVHTDNNLADPFTKALSNRKLTQHARGMGLRPASSFH
ncbi:retrotransposon protein, putative, ty1-copia subclass [Tanacetum coccineum]